MDVIRWATAPPVQDSAAASVSRGFAASQAFSQTSGGSSAEGRRAGSSGRLSVSLPLPLFETLPAGHAPRRASITHCHSRPSARAVSRFEQERGLGATPGAPGVEQDARLPPDRFLPALANEPHPEEDEERGTEEHGG